MWARGKVQKGINGLKRAKKWQGLNPDITK
jgi:hypothetical protein